MRHVLPIIAAAICLSGPVALATAFPTNSKLAFEHAKAAKKPMLILFEAAWCPPCNEMQEGVFETPAFIQRANSFELLNLDADADESASLVARYKVSSFPTMIFANPDGVEMTRVVGSRPAGEFMRIMDAALKRKNQPFIKACEGKTADDNYFCAISCAANDGTGGAEHAFEKLVRKVKRGSPRWFEAQSFFVEHKKDDASRRKTLEGLIRDWPKSPAALGFASDYVSMADDKNPATKPDTVLIDAVLANIPAMKSDPALAELGFVASDLPQLQAEILDGLGRKDQAAAAWKEAVVALESRKVDFPKDSPMRGLTLQLISALEFSGAPDKALALAQKYRVLFPKDPTFHRKAAGVLDRAGRTPEALECAKQAYALSYGANRIMAATLLVKLYGKTNSKAEAQKVYEEVTKTTKASDDPKNRAKRLLNDLQREWKKLT